MPLDKWFGTFREVFGSSKQYKGGWNEPEGAKQAKQTVTRGQSGFPAFWPKPQDALYLLLNVAGFAAFFARVAGCAQFPDLAPKAVCATIE
eukprot:355459_1